MNKKEIIELVGEDTVFEFQCMIDSLMEYKTVIPQLRDGYYIHYKVSLFHETLQPIFRSDTLTGFLDCFQIFEVAELSGDSTHRNVLHREKYISKNKTK